MKTLLLVSAISVLPFSGTIAMEAQGEGRLPTASLQIKMKIIPEEKIITIESRLNTIIGQSEARLEELSSISSLYLNSKTRQQARLKFNELMGENPVRRDDREMLKILSRMKTVNESARHNGKSLLEDLFDHEEVKDKDFVAYKYPRNSVGAGLIYDKAKRIIEINKEAINSTGMKMANTDIANYLTKIHNEAIVGYEHITTLVIPYFINIFQADELTFRKEVREQKVAYREIKEEKARQATAEPVKKRVTKQNKK